MLRNKQNAFTTVELLIATAVFSLVLIVAIFGFLQIGQIFYKGITATRTQDATESIINSIASDVRFASAMSLSPSQYGNTSDGDMYRYFCAGNHRYTYILGKRVSLASSDFANNFGLIRDDMLAGACANPFDPSTPFNNPTELLGDNMRLSILNVSSVVTSPPANPADFADMVNVNVRVAYGDNTALQVPSDPANISCNSSLRNSQYCHIANLATTVRRGF